MKKAQRGRTGRNTRGRRGLWFRAGTFAVVLVALAGVIYALWPKSPKAAQRYDEKVTVSMAGFDPNVIQLRVGTAHALWLVNPDSPYHSDGGGVHQFAVPDLGIDLRVQPRSTAIVQIPAGVAPGKYRFYCDTCCGGKDNPSMNGVLQVTSA